MNNEIREAKMSRASAKRNENKQVKTLLQGLGFSDVKVGHSGHGWLDIATYIATPADCFCADVPRNMGRCKTCSDAWQASYRQIKTEAKAHTGRTGEYDGYIQVRLVLR
jgi:hypothetical protein